MTNKRLKTWIVAHGFNANWHHWQLIATWGWWRGLGKSSESPSYGSWSWWYCGPFELRRYHHIDLGRRSFYWHQGFMYEPWE